MSTAWLCLMNLSGVVAVACSKSLQQVRTMNVGVPHSTWKSISGLSTIPFPLTSLPSLKNANTALATSSVGAQEANDTRARNVPNCMKRRVAIWVATSGPESVSGPAPGKPGSLSSTTALSPAAPFGAPKAMVAPGRGAASCQRPSSATNWVDHPGKAPTTTFCGAHPAAISKSRPARARHPRSGIEDEASDVRAMGALRVVAQEGLGALRGERALPRPDQRLDRERLAFLDEAAVGKPGPRGVEERERARGIARTQHAPRAEDHRALLAELAGARVLHERRGRDRVRSRRGMSGDLHRPRAHSRGSTDGGGRRARWLLARRRCLRRRRGCERLRARRDGPAHRAVRSND